MFVTFRADGFAAATFMLGAAIVGSSPCQAQNIPLASTLVAPALGAPAADVAAMEPAQTVVPVQLAHSMQTAVPVQAVHPAQTVQVAASSSSTVIPAVIAAPTKIAGSPAPSPASTAMPTIVARVFTPIVKAVRAVGIKGRASLAQLVATHRSSVIPNRERECLAGAIYFESKGEPLPGQVAVGQVIANRAKSGRFPKSYCGVVFQRSQFSFIRRQAMPPIPRASAQWKTAVAVAHIVANGLHDAVAPRSLFFHARYVSPNWKRLSRVATVGNHIFYR